MSVASVAITKGVAATHSATHRAIAKGLAATHSATYCHTLQYNAAHCNTLQHAATHCNTLQHAATRCNAETLYALSTADLRQVREAKKALLLARLR